MNVFDALFGKSQAVKSPARRRRTRASAGGTAPVVHRDAPTGGLGPGYSRMASPLGLEPLTDEPVDPAAPAALLDWEGGQAAREELRAGQDVAAGATPVVPRERVTAPPAPATTSRGDTGAWHRERLESANVPAVSAFLDKPDVPMTMGQRLLVEEAGRNTAQGDMSALKRTLLGLADKVDVTTRPDNAVVMLKSLPGDQVGAQVRSALGLGKQTVDMTQGGRLFNRVAPMLRQYGGLDVNGPIDGALGRVAERFAGAAEGGVDVVFGVGHPKTSAAAAIEAAELGTDTPYPSGPDVDAPASTATGQPGASATGMDQTRQGVTDAEKAAAAAGGAGKAPSAAATLAQQQSALVAQQLANNAKITAINLQQLMLPAQPGGPAQLVQVASVTQAALLQKLGQLQAGRMGALSSLPLGGLLPGLGGGGSGRD